MELPAPASPPAKAVDTSPYVRPAERPENGGRPRTRRWAIGVVAALLALAALGVVLFPVLVRWRVGRAAAALGVSVDVGAVRPLWFGARLVDVSVRLDGVDHVSARFPEIRGGWSPGGSWVRLDGGEVSAWGEPSVVLEELQAWRARRPAGSGAEGGGRRLEIGAVRVRWSDPPSERSVVAEGVGLVERGEVRVVSATSVLATGPGLELDARGVEVWVVRGTSTALERVSAKELHARGDTGSKLLSGGGSERAAGPGTAPRAPRERLDAVVARVMRPFSEAAVVQIDSAEAAVVHEGETVRFGPGPLQVERKGRGLAASWRAGSAAAEGRALGFRLDVPPAVEQPVSLELEGGPLSLAALGVRDGELGVTAPERAALRVRAKLELVGSSARFDGEVSASKLSLRHKALADDVVEDLEVGMRAKLALDWAAGSLDVESAEVRLGGAALRVAGKATGWRDAAGVLQARTVGTFEVPLVGCQTILDGLPKGLVPTTSGVRMAGSFALKGKARIDTTKLEMGKHDRDFLLDWDATSSCRVTEVPPALHVSRFRGPFTRTVFTPDGKPAPLESGPKTVGWVPRGSLSPFLEAAVMTTEDGGFRRHSGFDKEAIRNSIRENLRQRRFVRGASTISMQLAKNLYLDRKKSLSRKLQEAILTTYLEQELTKEQILELYLNVVELGPMIYGVGPAANHYFHTSASQLAASQAFYLATLLPNPKETHVGAGGAVSAGWSGHIRTLLKIAFERKRISEDELDEALRETVVIGSPSPHRSSKEPEISIKDAAAKDAPAAGP